MPTTYMSNMIGPECVTTISPYTPQMSPLPLFESVSTYGTSDTHFANTSFMASVYKDHHMVSVAPIPFIMHDDIYTADPIQDPPSVERSNVLNTSNEGREGTNNDRLIQHDFRYTYSR